MPAWPYSVGDQRRAVRVGQGLAIVPFLSSTRAVVSPTPHILTRRGDLPKLDREANGAVVRGGSCVYNDLCFGRDGGDGHPSDADGDYEDDGGDVMRNIPPTGYIGNEHQSQPLLYSSIFATGLGPSTLPR